MDAEQHWEGEGAVVRAVTVTHHKKHLRNLRAALGTYGVDAVVVGRHDLKLPSQQYGGLYRRTPELVVFLGAPGARPTVTVQANESEAPVFRWGDDGPEIGPVDDEHSAARRITAEHQAPPAA